jgi:hypothetical protein
MERRSVATLILTTVCFAACDSGSKPPEKQQEAPAPASQPAPSAERDQPPASSRDTKQPPSSSGSANKQPPPSSGSVSKKPPPPSTGKQPPPATPPAPPTKPEQAGGGRGETAGRSFSIYALSRGSGVPPAAREAQQKVQALVESDRGRGVGVNVQATRLGLEGERKLCVTYADAQEAARALERVRALVQGVDLVNVVVEPCGPPSSASPPKEKPQ